MTDFTFLGPKITADADCSHEIKRHLLLGRKAMIKLDSILKSRDITLPTQVRLVKAMVFPIAVYGCESWTIKTAAAVAVASVVSDSVRPHRRQPTRLPGILQARTLEWVKKAECQRIDAFELWCWRRLLRVPWTARRSNQSIRKEISPGCSLEGLMLKLKFQYFGHLMRRTDSLEKILMLGKIEGRKKRG